MFTASSTCPRVLFPFRNDRYLDAVRGLFGVLVHFGVNCLLVGKRDAWCSAQSYASERGRVYHDTAVQFHGFVLILVGMKGAFKTRLVAFLRCKIFHGGQDLIFEPSRKFNRKDECWKQHYVTWSHPEIPCNGSSLNKRLTYKSIRPCVQIYINQYFCDSTTQTHASEWEASPQKLTV